MLTAAYLCTPDRSQWAPGRWGGSCSCVCQLAGVSEGTGYGKQWLKPQPLGCKKCCLLPSQGYLCTEWVGLNPRTFLCCLKQADNGKVMWSLANMLNFFLLAQSNRTFGLDLCLEQTQSGRFYPILRNSQDSGGNSKTVQALFLKFTSVSEISSWQSSEKIDLTFLCDRDGFTGTH